MNKLISKARAMAAQENCDGPEYNMIQNLADYADELETKLIKIDYKNFRIVKGMKCGIRIQMFTVAVFYDIDIYGYEGKFSFDTFTNAVSFLVSWDGVTEPIIHHQGCVDIKGQKHVKG